MKHLSYLTIGAATALLGLVGCVDDNYKINDANTLSQISINDLTIPLNLEKICLDSIVDLTDGTNVEILVDPETGKEYYALTEEGTVESEPIEISPIDVQKPVVNPTSVNITPANTTPSGKKKADGQTMNFGLEKMEADFEYHSPDIDEAVVSILALETAKPTKIGLTLSLPSSLSIAKTSVSDLRLEFPKGLKNKDNTPAKANIGTYNDKTGIVTISSYEFTNPYKIEVVVSCDVFDFEEASAKIDANRRFSYEGTMGVAKNGHINITPASGASIPSSLQLTAEYDLAAFSVSNFTGDLDYKVDDTKIDPIHLDDLPDFLQDPNTRIIMSDPRFFFSLENPTAKYGTKGSGHIDLKSFFNFNGSYNSESPEFIIPALENSSICLSPSGKVTDVPAGFSDNLSQYVYPQMKYLLCGDPSHDTAEGLPSEIQVAFENARFFGHATNFPVSLSSGVSKPVGTIKGHYKFVAPLGFDKESIIVYSESANIGGDEMDNVFVKYLTVEANGESSFPVNVQLNAVAYDMDDNILGRSNTLDIPALSTNPIVLTIAADTEDGFMRNIDRLDFKAIIRQEDKGAGVALGPDQGLELTNLKIKVSGYYEKKF